MTKLVNLAAFLFFALSLCVKSGYSYGTLLLLGAAIVTLPRWWPQRSRHPAIAWIALSFALMGAAGIADAWFSNLAATHYNIPIRFLIVPLILYFLSAYPPDARAIWLGAACGAVLGAMSAHYYTHYAPELLQYGRGARYLNPIQFGNLAILLTIFSACGLRGRPQTWQRVVLLIGIAAGLYAAMLSETRGSLLGLVFALLVLGMLRLRARHLRPRNLLIAAALCTSAISAIVLKEGDIIEERLQAAREDIALYQQGETETSVGLRLEMWRFAWSEGWRYPLLGAGTAQMREDMSAWEQAQGTQGTITSFGHLHNEFLDAFARRGLLGLALVLFLFALPLWLYLRPRLGEPGRYNSDNNNESSNASASASASNGNDAQSVALRLAGAAHILLYCGFGLTQAALYGHNSGFHFFALPLFLICTAWLARGRG